MPYQETKKKDKGLQLESVHDEERLVPKDFTYGPKEIEADVLRAVNGLRFEEYPQEGLKMSEETYEAWIAAGKPLRTLVGVPGDRPNFYVGAHKNRYTSDGVTLKDHVEDVRALGAEDKQQIPFHPYLQAMLTKSDKGIVTGPGFYYRLGENKTADPVIFRVHDGRLQVLLIERTDGGGFALPGGHVDPEDKALSTNPALVAIAAAMREVGEEAGVKNLHDVDRAIVLEDAVVGDWRATANAWPVTSVVLFMPDEKTAQAMEIKPGDDAKGAEWRSTWIDMSENNLFASHESYIKLAILKWEELTGNVVKKDGSVVKAA